MRGRMQRALLTDNTKEKSAWLHQGSSWDRALREEGENLRGFMKVFMHLLKQVTAFQIHEINKN